MCASRKAPASACPWSNRSPSCMAAPSPLPANSASAPPPPSVSRRGRAGNTPRTHSTNPSPPSPEATVLLLHLDRHRRPLRARRLRGQRAATFDEELRRRVASGPLRRGRRKVSLGLRPMPVAIGCEAGLIVERPGGPIADAVVGHGEELVDGHALAAAVDRHPVQLPHDDGIAGGA